MAKGHKTGGRKAGTPNKSTTEVKELAEAYTKEALDRLAFWMRSDNAKASVSAAIAILDRGHGKPSQIISGKIEHEHLVSTGDADSLDNRLTRALQARTENTVQ